MPVPSAEWTSKTRFAGPPDAQAIRRGTRSNPRRSRRSLDLARFAPNHKLTQPWRFRVLGPETRARSTRPAGDKEAAKLRRAPTLVLATALLSGDAHDGRGGSARHRVRRLRGPARRHRTRARLVLAHTRGFEEPAARGVLRPAANERVVALIHLGPAVSEPPAKERLALDDVLEFVP